MILSLISYRCSKICFNLFLLIFQRILWLMCKIFIQPLDWNYRLWMNKSTFREYGTSQLLSLSLLVCAARKTLLLMSTFFLWLPFLKKNRSWRGNFIIFVEKLFFACLYVLFILNFNGIRTFREMLQLMFPFCYTSKSKVSHVFSHIIIN